MKQRDRWLEQTEALIASLRERRAQIGGDAQRLKEEFERRYELLKAEHSALKTEIEALVDVVAIHRSRLSLGQPALPAPASPSANPRPLRALPSSVRVKVAEPEEGTTVAFVKRWAREHDGELRSSECAAALFALGGHKTLESAAAGIGWALSKIGSGFERVGRGVYRFYSIDGVAVQAIDDEAESA